MERTSMVYGKWDLIGPQATDYCSLLHTPHWSWLQCRDTWKWSSSLWSMELISKSKTVWRFNTQGKTDTHKSNNFCWLNLERRDIDSFSSFEVHMYLRQTMIN